MTDDFCVSSGNSGYQHEPKFQVYPRDLWVAISLRTIVRARHWLDLPLDTSPVTASPPCDSLKRQINLPRGEFSSTGRLLGCDVGRIGTTDRLPMEDMTRLWHVSEWMHCPQSDKQLSGHRWRHRQRS